MDPKVMMAAVRLAGSNFYFYQRKQKQDEKHDL
jgi:hypothetical protein